MKIAFLACPETMPRAATRRGDAFEHDLQVAALRPAIEAVGGELVEIDWHSPLADFAGFDCALLGTAWDYQDQPDSFLKKLQQLVAAGIDVHNPPALVRWNMDKTYLRDLSGRSARIIPTLWSDNPCRSDIAAALDHFGSEQVVVKPQIGAGGTGQHVFGRETLPPDTWQMGQAAMIQPFLAAIKHEGELSLVFIDGAFSHAIRKIPAADEYRVQSLFGGREEPITPSDSDISAAASILAAIPFETPLYARIDLLRADDGELMVMEAEAIEPFLYPAQGPDLGPRLAEAIRWRLENR
ncbi:MAG: hypothetical protein WAT93_03385 [Pontixanthobacter sp.]